MTRPTPYLWLPIALPTLLFCLLTPTRYTTEALAGRSPNRRKKNAAATSNSGGFGKPIAASQNLSTKKKPAYIPDTSTTTQNLVNYLEEEECEGVGVEGGTEIGFCGTTGRRGLFAADDFQIGEFILGIPFPCCVTLAKDDIMVGEPSDPELGLRLLKLLSETTSSDKGKGNNKKFGRYFRSFPTLEEHFDATPDFWTLPEIEQLELPPILEKASERKQEIGQLAKSQDVDESELQFDTWLVKSRGFTLLKPTPQQSSIISKTVLMPYLDMINNDGPESANVKLQVLETKAEDESMYALQASRPIRKGSEIILTYGTGQESTVDMLSSYGFLPKKNPNDIKYMNETWSDFKWSSTLEEDTAELESIGADDSDSALKKILEFRIQMKSSQAKFYNATDTSEL